MRRPLRPLALILVACWALALAGCGGKPASQPQGAAPAQPQAQPQGAAPAQAQQPAATAAKAKQLTKLRVATVKALSDGPMLLAEARGYFADEGIQLEVARINAPPQMVPLLASGDLDIAGSSVTASLFNALLTNLDIKIVATKSAITPKHGYAAVMVRKDLVENGQYKSPKDLKGRRVGTPGGKGVSLEVYLSVLAEKHGFRIGDMQVSQIGLPDMPAAMTNKSLDAVFALEPIATVLESQGLAVRAVPGDEILPNHDLGLFVYSPKFMKEKPELAQGFMNAYVRGLVEYDKMVQDGKHSPELAAILAKETGSKVELVAKATAAAASSTGTGEVNMESLRFDYEFYRKQGYIKEDVDLSKLVDHTYVRKAHQLLKKTS